jgi:hypothetical protein
MHGENRCRADGGHELGQAAKCSCRWIVAMVLR